MARRTYAVTMAGLVHELEVEDARDGTLDIRDPADPGGAPHAVALEPARGALRTAVIDGRRFDFGVVIRDGVYHLVVDGIPYELAVDHAQAARLRAGAGSGSAGVHSGRLTAPIPGRVVRIGVAVGDRVERGQPILVLDAMKLENELAAPKGGIVLALPVKPGQAVEKGQLLVELGD